MTPDQRTFSELTTSLFGAALGQLSWFDFVRAMSRHAGDINTHMFGFDTQTGQTLSLVHAGYDPEFITSYEDYYGQLNAWADGFAAQPQGVAVDTEVMCSTPKLLKTEFYNDWVAPQEDIRAGGGGLIFKNDTRFFAVGANIRARDAETKKEPWLRLVQTMLPHMQQAFEMSRMLAGQKLEVAMMSSLSLPEVPGVLILSDTAGIIFANATAEQMLNTGTPISYRFDGGLSFGSGSQRHAINRGFLLHRLNGPMPSFSVMTAPRGQGPAHKLRFAKLDAQAQAMLPLGDSLGIGGPCVILLVSAVRQASDDTALLSARFGLTKAEAEVAQLLMQGQSSRSISEHRATSIHTVRAQVKSVLMKTQTNRQTELVRCLFDALAATRSPFG